MAIASAEQAVENAQVALENARNAHESAVAQAATSNAETQIQVETGLNDVAAAKANQAATEEVGQQSGNSDQVSVENSRQALQDAQNEFEAQKRTTEQELVVQRRQRDQAGISARNVPSRSARRRAHNGNDNTTACSAAKRSENEARASLRTAEAQLNQAEASARQTMIQAAVGGDERPERRPDRRGQHQHRPRQHPAVQHLVAVLGQVRRGRPEDGDGVRRLDEDPERRERRTGQDLGRLGRVDAAHGDEDAGIERVQQQASVVPGPERAGAGPRRPSGSAEAGWRTPAPARPAASSRPRTRSNQQEAALGRRRRSTP